MKKKGRGREWEGWHATWGMAQPKMSSGCHHLNQSSR